MLVALAALLASGALRLTATRSSEASQKPRERLEVLCELVGHAAPLLRVGAIGPVARAGEELRLALAAHGASLSAQGCLAAALMGGACSGALGAAAACGAAGAIVGVVAWAAACVAFAGKRRRERDLACAAQMPEVLRTLSGCLAAGQSLAQALVYLGANVSEPLGPEFARASFQVASGMPVEDAVDGLCRRVDAPGMALLGTALCISQRTGSPLGDLLHRCARMVSSAAALRRDLMVKTSQGRLSARIVACVPLLVVGVLVLISPDYRSGLATPLGRGALAVSALLDITALWLVRRVMSGSLR